ncbi:hypothetical protein WG66_005632 [Moniliophthora roreri]|uniref:Uncharacterized protein n=1 Tax=Moniliophthora roreri TaxID=221103 RepID=A0A0W0FAB9_MONRR|nr:hypothetical protein WG66_005632 [Moniliophthora roreri]
MGILRWLSRATESVCKLAGIESSPIEIMSGLAGTVAKSVPVLVPILSPLSTPSFDKSERRTIGGADAEIAQLKQSTE